MEVILWYVVYDWDFWWVYWDLLEEDEEEGEGREKGRIRIRIGEGKSFRIVK